MANMKNVVESASLARRPGIFIVGSPNVGKRTLLSRLLSVDFEDASDSSSDVLAYGWTISTKYYTADVSVWMSHLHDGFSIGSLPIYDRLTALVMVFDMSDLSSLATLKDWVSRTDIQKFDILLCIGNKVDLLPGHSAHVEYRRRMQKLGDSSFDSEFSDYGISETEGISLLGDEEPQSEITKSCMEWCTEHNIEYIEACASNADFDKCLSVDGDLQGVERLYGALSAYMWPGMVLKSGDKINEPSLPEKQEMSDEESDYEIEYEALSAGSAEPWDDTDGGWVSAGSSAATSYAGSSVTQTIEAKECEDKDIISVKGEQEPSTSMSHSAEENGGGALTNADEPEEASELNMGAHYEFENLEQIMSEIGNMRDSLRLVPDFQRREMAAKLALKMAAMFEDSSGGEEGF
ncbi:hypothetical protein RHGRI_030346 [Rhododendron griersonianum]|uniref:Trigalactosyldiacylglycerol 1 n=1 Tax=Rhododendron griersonianum TaxID=479676 RepID=A0AAV6IMJ7_9ERIC|nr:hypothetical protein RHGRI_030346 [Rhododendron griersonianum]KAG5529936.1 hypothetical protein RHGRI_030346 [Rhododendron griersonianum]KAG5529937.1 hypothetical protein RHGRI_030346 [Rhododendron griersonianum]